MDCWSDIINALVTGVLKSHLSATAATSISILIVKAVVWYAPLFSAPHTFFRQGGGKEDEETLNRMSKIIKNKLHHKQNIAYSKVTYGSLFCMDANGRQ